MWDLKPVLVDFERLFGRDQTDLDQPCLNSIHDWRGYCQFYFAQSKRLMDEAIGGRPHHDGGRRDVGSILLVAPRALIE